MGYAGTARPARKRGAGMSAAKKSTRRPPLSHYIKAGLPVLRLFARIERAADLVPGSISEDALAGIENTAATRPAAWASWIASGFVHEDGGPYTADERDRLAVRLATIIGEAAL